MGLSSAADVECQSIMRFLKQEEMETLVATCLLYTSYVSAPFGSGFARYGFGEQTAGGGDESVYHPAEAGHGTG